MHLLGLDDHCTVCGCSGAWAKATGGTCMEFAEQKHWAARTRAATPTQPVAQNAAVAQLGQQEGTGQQSALTESIKRAFVDFDPFADCMGVGLVPKNLPTEESLSDSFMRAAAEQMRQAEQLNGWPDFFSAKPVPVADTFRQDSEYTRVLLLGAFRLVALLQLLEKHPRGLCPGDVRAELDR